MISMEIQDACSNTECNITNRYSITEEREKLNENLIEISAANKNKKRTYQYKRKI